MKNKRLAILLSAAMTLTSLQTGGVLVYAEEFSAEDFVSEDSFTGELADDETEMEIPVEAGNDGFLSEEEGFTADLDETEMSFDAIDDEDDDEDDDDEIVTIEGMFPDKKLGAFVSEKYDTNKDGILQASEAESVTRMDISGLGIYNLQGMDNFKNLTWLDCSNNEILTLDFLGSMKELQYLDCSNNKCDEYYPLHLSGYPKLTYLDCSSNYFAELNVSNNTELTELHCENNRITRLDLSNNNKLGNSVSIGNQNVFTDIKKENGEWKLSILNFAYNMSKVESIEYQTSDGQIHSLNAVNGWVSWNNEDFSTITYKYNTGYQGANQDIKTLPVNISFIYDSEYKCSENTDGTLTITSYSGNDQEIVIPETLGGRKVTGISAIGGVFSGRDITSVSMPGIESIGMQTFAYCLNLKTVYMPNVKSIGLSAFSGSGIEKINAPSLTYVAPGGFAECKLLNEVNAPGLTGIGRGAFQNCTSLKEFPCSERLTEIIDRAFYNTGLTSIRLRGNVNIYGTPIGFGESGVVEGFKIYGESGTTVEEYAKANGFEFIDITSEPIVCKHVWEEITENATCTKEGLTYKKCKFCGEKEEGSEKVISKTDHKITLKNQKAATCTEKGYTGDKVCDNCGTIVEVGNGISATGHKTTVKNQKIATCTEKGYTGDKICDVCGTVVEAGKEIPAAGHKTSVKNQKNVTCTEKGYTGDKICDVCGATVEAGKEIPATGHKYGDYKVTKAATIFEAGTETRECSVCKAQESREIPKLASAVKLSTASLPIQVKKSVSANALIADMEVGDSISSLKTSNAKVAAVSNSTFKITAKKAGKATITITMKSGASADVTVTVKKGKITTTKITGIQKSITLKKGKKLTLKPVLNPITSSDKVTYSSSNKKIASVSAKGVVKASKKGKVTIKVKSGKKTVTCKVTVK